MKASLFALLMTSVTAGALFAQQYDLVLSGGRVMDPESGLDAVRDVGIRAGKIAAISERPLQGRTRVDVKGLVVSPGFIDLHSHGQDDENYRYKARDGVTTALEMEVGVYPVKEWYQERTGKALINYGATSGHIPARMKVMHDPGAFLPTGPAAHRIATVTEMRDIEDLVRRGLDEGALGIGMGIAYVPSATHPEILSIFRIAADRKVACYVHTRSVGTLEPGSTTESMEEVIAGAAITGASIHVVHITSMSLKQTGLALEMIDGARKRGLDVTTEAYPYTAGQTAIDSAMFDPGWQDRLSITYHDLQWVATGERLTAESFDRYRKSGGFVILHAIPEEAARQAIAYPGVMIASDGRIEQGKGHPRGAGTYARVLGRYVREENALPLMTAIQKISLLPARRLESVSPQMAHKGRIKVGADADIAVFDPARVIDKATFDKPDQYSEGIPFVLVNGVFVVRDGKLVEDAKPGVGIRSRN
jgi:N-acyl-D-aspartate/D-glutamate deacylase